MAIQNLNNTNLSTRSGQPGFAYTYPVSGAAYTVSISAGYFPRNIFRNNNSGSGGPNKKLTRIVSFGVLQSATNLDNAWANCTNLSSLPVGGNLGNCQSFNSTWLGCTGLTSFPVTNVSKCKVFESTWNFCRGLRDFASLDFSSATDFGGGSFNTGAWYECRSLSSFGAPTNTTNLTSIRYAWSNCVSLKTFPFFNTSNVTNFVGAWNNCTSLTGFPVLDTSKSTSFGETWRTCTGLSSFPQLDVSKGVLFYATWADCINLKDFPSLSFLSAADFGTTNFTTYGPWYNCQSLSSFGAPTNTSNLTSMCYAWSNCVSLKTFPFFNTSNVTNFEGPWMNCTGLTGFPVLDTSKGRVFRTAWTLCTNLSSFPALNFSEATNCLQAWDTCPSLLSFPSTNFPKVTSLQAAWQIQNPASYVIRMTTFNQISCPLLTGFSGGTLGGLRETWRNQIALTSFPPISCPLNDCFVRTWENCASLSTVGGGFNFFSDTFKSMVNGTECFKGVTLATQTWSSILTSICAININTNVPFHGGNSKRNTAGHTAAVHLTGVRGWTITDGGQA